MASQIRFSEDHSANPLKPPTARARHDLANGMTGEQFPRVTLADALSEGQMRRGGIEPACCTVGSIQEKLSGSARENIFRQNHTG